MAKKEKSICLIFDPAKKLDKISLMNNLANVVQVLHSDPSVGSIKFQFVGKDVKGGAKSSVNYEIKIK